jgi:putative hydrolase of the HAD superfamily
MGHDHDRKVHPWNHAGVVDAVTFDFWNTLMWEEPGSLREQRLEIWAQRLAEAGMNFDGDRLEGAHDAAHEEYVEAWTAGRQFRVEDAVPRMLERLDADRDGETATILAEGFSEAGRLAAVHPSSGVRHCLEALKAADVRIGIICDIGLTPSPVVGELLDRHGLLGFFDGMSFSDEVGHYKPSAAIFEHALASVGGVSPQRAAHVGDRRRTDIGGAIAMGMTAVRYNAVYEDDSVPAPEGDFVTADLEELPSLLGVAG